MGSICACKHHLPARRDRDESIAHQHYSPSLWCSKHARGFGSPLCVVAPISLSAGRGHRLPSPQGMSTPLIATPRGVL